jgi:hypothetical protein
MVKDADTVDIITNLCAAVEDDEEDSVMVTFTRDASISKPFTIDDLIDAANAANSLVLVLVASIAIVAVTAIDVAVPFPVVDDNTHTPVAEGPYPEGHVEPQVAMVVLAIYK